MQQVLYYCFRVVFLAVEDGATALLAYIADPDPASLVFHVAVAVAVAVVVA